MAAVCACIACGAAGSAGGASAAVYWDEIGGIAAAAADGSSPNYGYFKPPFPSDSAFPGCGLAVSATHLYWVGTWAIGRVNLEGPAVPTTVSPHLQQPCGVAVDGSHVYWADTEAGTIGRANLDGTEATTTLVGDLLRPCGVAVDGGHVYWAAMNGIGRANLDGSQPERAYFPILPRGCGLALDSQYLYWSNDREIGRITLGGLFRQDDFIADLDHVAGIAVDAGHVYWMNVPEGPNYSSIGRADINGSDANRSWIPTRKFNGAGVAVDARPSPPPLPLPSRPFTVGKVSHSLKDGTAILHISVPERGELVVNSPGIGWKVLKGPEPPPYRLGSFNWRLKLWPGKTRFGKKVRKRLRDKGRAPLTLRLTYTEQGQLPLPATKRITLLQRRH